MEKCNDFVESFYREYFGKEIKVLPFRELAEVLELSQEEMSTVSDKYGCPFSDAIAGLFITADGIQEARDVFNKFGWPTDNWWYHKAEFSMKVAYNDGFRTLFKATCPLVAACLKNTFESVDLAVEILEKRAGFHYKLTVDYDFAFGVAKRFGQIEVMKIIQREFPNVKFDIG